MYEPGHMCHLYIYTIKTVRRYRDLGVLEAVRDATELSGALKHCCLPHGSHLALEMAGRACLGATGRSKMVLWRCLGATWHSKMLPLVALHSASLHSVLLCYVHGYARVHTSMCISATVPPARDGVWF